MTKLSKLNHTSCLVSLGYHGVSAICHTIIAGQHLLKHKQVPREILCQLVKSTGYTVLAIVVLRCSR